MRAPFSYGPPFAPKIANQIGHISAPRADTLDLRVIDEMRAHELSEEYPLFENRDYDLKSHTGTQDLELLGKKNFRMKNFSRTKIFSKVAGDVKFGRKKGSKIFPKFVRKFPKIFLKRRVRGPFFENFRLVVASQDVSEVTRPRELAQSGSKGSSEEKSKKNGQKWAKISRNRPKSLWKPAQPKVLRLGTTCCEFLE